MITRQCLLTGILLGLALGFAGATTLNAATTLITYDNVTDFMVMSDQTDDAITGSTPKVTVTYSGDLRGWASAWFPEGDGATGGSIYNTGIAGVGTITFTAAAGYRVRVNSLVLRVRDFNQPSSSGLLEYSLNSGQTWTEQVTDVALGETGLITFDNVAGAVVMIRWWDNDPSKLLGEADAGLDNISYTAIKSPEISDVTFVAGNPTVEIAGEAGKSYYLVYTTDLASITSVDPPILAEWEIAAGEASLVANGTVTLTDHDPDDAVRYYWIWVTDSPL